MGIRYYADLPDGSVIMKRDGEKGVGHNGGNSSGPSSFRIWDGAAWIPVSRIVKYKSNPSKHKCDARCQ